MKKLMLAICMLFGVAVAANAQQQQQQSQDTTSTSEPSTDYRTNDPSDPAGQEDQATQQQDDQDATTQDDATQGDATQDDATQDSETTQSTDVNQDTEASQSSSGVSADEDLEMISVAELPAIVRESLESQEYSGWTVTSAHKKEKEGKIFYKVEMQNGSETKKVKFDEQGNKVKEMKGDHKDHQ